MVRLGAAAKPELGAAVSRKPDQILAAVGVDVLDVEDAKVRRKRVEAEPVGLQPQADPTAARS